MKDLVLTSGIVGFLLPFLIALVNQAHWQAGLKAVVAFAICLIGAFVTTWAEDKLSLSNYIISALTVFALARTSYAGLWRPTGAAPSLEASTTVSSPRRT